jgi:predicted nuclease with TOPRIM domain
MTIKQPKNKTTYDRMKQELSDLRHDNDILVDACKKRDKRIEECQKKIAELEDQIASAEALHELIHKRLFSLSDMLRFAKIGMED